MSQQALFVTEKINQEVCHPYLIVFIDITHKATRPEGVVFYIG